MSEDRVRRIALRFYRDNPTHSEVLEWLDSLPTDGRGAKYNRDIEEVLVRHAREELKKTRGKRKAVQKTGAAPPPLPEIPLESPQEPAITPAEPDSTPAPGPPAASSQGQEKENPAGNARSRLMDVAKSINFG